MVYNYTKPRRPIAAMYNSPGPCYGLPSLVGKEKHDPRSVHGRAPAWPLGVRHGKYRDEAGPGPAYLPDPKILRNGKDGSPHYSLYSRPKEFSLYSVPGPGAYAPEKTIGNNYYTRAAAYSFGIRHRERSTDDIPGPNKYSLDPMLGKTVRSEKHSAPIYSLTSRSKIGGFHEDLQKTPGPGNYSVTEPATYKDKAPVYSLTGRNVMPGDSTQKPGPGAYKPENWRPLNRSSSFGIRHSQYKGEFITDADIE
jgi:hypothetical protein